MRVTSQDEELTFILNENILEHNLENAAEKF